MGIVKLLMNLRFGWWITLNVLVVLCSTLLGGAIYMVAIGWQYTAIIVRCNTPWTEADSSLMLFLAISATLCTLCAITGYKAIYKIIYFSECYKPGRGPQTQ